MGFEWQVEPEQVFTELARDYVEDIHTQVLAIAGRYAVEIESWMKANAPWTDRTANARQTLRTAVADLATQVEISLSHGVEYGKFLELANGGRYAVIGPALDFFVPKIWNAIKEMLSGSR